MKLSFGVLLSSAVALAFAVVLTHWAGDPPASDSLSVRVPRPVPGAEATVRRASSDAKAGALSAVTGSDKRTDTQQKAIAALREEVALLRAEVSAVQRQVHEQGNEADPANDPRTDPAARAEADRARQEQMAVIGATFRQEPVDPGWSFKAVGAVQEALASDETVRPALRSLECRSQTCRVELAEDDTGELTTAIPVFLHRLGETLPRVTANYIGDGAGGKTMILYMDRGASESPRR